MAETKDGGPAFPEHVAISPSGDIFGSHYYSSGMSLRDYFAGQALAGILADPSNGGHIKMNAGDAYAYADAMLSAREGQGGGS